MKILLSPAKLMSLDSESIWNKTSTPPFISEAEIVMNSLKKLNPKDLMSKMKISQNLAEMNFERNLDWKSKPSTKESTTSILAFKGEVYRGLNAENLSESAQIYLNTNLFILSGLYGILRPSDRLMLYRLEMGTILEVEDAKSLYAYWDDSLTNYLNSKLKKNEIVLNLASHEYSKVLNLKKLNAQIIDVDFLDFKDGKLKKITVYFKHQRGALTRYCAENKVETSNEIKLYNHEGYSFDEKLSSDSKLVFVR